MKDNIATKIICQGFKNGGVEYVSNFPGFHSHNIFSGLGGEQISINERVAYETAYGASLAGKRSLVAMKNVGLNVAADPFLHSIIAGVNAGLVVVITDDTKAVASQERQDSRHFFDFYGGLWFEPNSLESAYQIAKDSFKLSEELDVPVVIRLTNQFFELEGDITLDSTVSPGNNLGIANNPEKFVVYPTFWLNQYKNLSDKNGRIRELASKFSKNKAEDQKNEKGLIVFGSCWQELGQDDYNDWDKLLVETYPIPKEEIEEFIKNKKEIKVIEQGDNYGFRIIQRLLSQTDGVIVKSETGQIQDMEGKWTIWSHLENLFLAIKNSDPSFVVGDVGQYTVESTNTIGACLCLGSSVGTGMGLAMAGVEYPFCVVGDTSFLHSGTQALAEAKARNIKMGIIVIDNGGSMATGGQSTASSIYEFTSGIDTYEVDYKTATQDQLETLLKQMKDTGKLSILFVKV
ncbi:MAG: thiamine pyrophosphate-dependent enzyme [Nitrospirota bacterium]